MKLGKEGWVLRSRAARGADSAFEAGADAAHGGKEFRDISCSIKDARLNDHFGREEFTSGSA
jgi:hypothetical protein